MGNTHLEAELRASKLPEKSFTVEESDHAFESREGSVYRRNRIWRVEKGAGPAGRQLVLNNNCLCMYAPEDVGSPKTDKQSSPIAEDSC